MLEDRAKKGRTDSYRDNLDTATRTIPNGNEGGKIRRVWLLRSATTWLYFNVAYESRNRLQTFVPFHEDGCCIFNKTVDLIVKIRSTVVESYLAAYRCTRERQRDIDIKRGGQNQPCSPDNQNS
jgi:hypothetical protein